MTAENDKVTIPFTGGKSLKVEKTWSKKPKTDVLFEPVKNRSSLPDIGIRKVELGRIIDLPLESGSYPQKEKKLTRAMIIPDKTEIENMDVIESMN